MKRWIALCSCVAVLGTGNLFAEKKPEVFHDLESSPQIFLVLDFTHFIVGQDATQLVVVSTSTEMGESFLDMLQHRLTEKGYTPVNRVLAGGGFSLKQDRKAVVIQNANEKYYDSKDERDRRGTLAIKIMVDKSKLFNPPYYHDPKITPELCDEFRLLFAPAIKSDSVPTKALVSGYGIAPHGHAIIVSAEAMTGSEDSGPNMGVSPLANALGSLFISAENAGMRAGLYTRVSILNLETGEVVWTSRVDVWNNPTPKVLESVSKSLFENISSRADSKTSSK